MNCLYNGVELPEIPVYDHENPVEGYTDPCPYAVLVSGSDTPYEYDCYLYAAPFYAKDGRITPVSGSMAQCHHYGYVDGVWQYINSWHFSGGTALTGTAFWTNTDIYMRDDTSVLYLAASDPAPVLSIDHTAMVQGWIVGKRLAGMRDKTLHKL